MCREIGGRRNVDKAAVDVECYYPVVFGDVCYVHYRATLPCLERRFAACCKFRLVVLSVGGYQRPCVAGHGCVAGVVRAFVCLDNVDILVGAGVVDLGFVPDCLLEVDMPYQHAVAGYVFVPSCFLTVLKEEEFIGLVCLREASAVGCAEFFKPYGVRVAENDRNRPSKGIALVHGVIWRGATVVVVGAVVHCRPVAGCIRCGGAVCMIQVGQSHYV